MTEPARHYGSGVHRADAGSKPVQWPLARRLRRIRPQYLTAAAVAVALVVAGGVYASVQTGTPVDSPAAAAATPSGTAVASTADGSPGITDADGHRCRRDSCAGSH